VLDSETNDLALPVHFVEVRSFGDPLLASKMLRGSN
jgi:hypothetical protein